MPTPHHYAALVSPSPSPPPHFHPRPRSINTSLHRVPSSLSSSLRSSSSSSSSSPSTPNSPDTSSTLTPTRRRTPRPLPEPPRRPSSTDSASSIYSDAPEPVLCIIREIDHHLSGFTHHNHNHDYQYQSNSVAKALPPLPPSSLGRSTSSPPLFSHPTLRRKYSPRRESLRELRNRDSEARLQEAYERQLRSYLDGSWFRSTRREVDVPF